MEKIKSTKLISIGLGVIIAILLIIVGFKIFQGVFTRAADVEPRDVIISGILQNTAKITWSSGIETQGIVEYGTSPTALNFYAPEVQAVKSHVIDLTLLSPNTTYYFDIRIGEKKYDNGGVPWTFTTKDTQKSAETKEIPKTVVSKPTPTAYQELTVESKNPPVISTICEETDCQKICQKLGKGCSTSNLIKNKCVGKINVSNCGLMATPAATATPAK